MADDEVGPVKQVLLYRRDLKMRKGKIAAQCAHASLAVFLRRGAVAQGHLVVPLDVAMLDPRVPRDAARHASVAP